MDWLFYVGCVVLLVIDVGVLCKNDLFGCIQMNEVEVCQVVLCKGVKIYVLYLCILVGKNNYGYVEQQYCSFIVDVNLKIVDFYILVVGGEVNVFGNMVKEIGMVFVDLVYDVGNCKLQVLCFDVVLSVVSKLVVIGYVMQMEFFGCCDLVCVLQVVIVWIVDCDLINLVLLVFQVCVLLSKL